MKAVRRITNEILGISNQNEWHDPTSREIQKWPLQTEETYMSRLKPKWSLKNPKQSLSTNQTWITWQILRPLHSTLMITMAQVVKLEALSGLTFCKNMHDTRCKSLTYKHDYTPSSRSITDCDFTSRTNSDCFRSSFFLSFFLFLFFNFFRSFLFKLAQLVFLFEGSYRIWNTNS